jgi:hypothetical protein
MSSEKFDRVQFGVGLVVILNQNRILPTVFNIDPPSSVGYDGNPFIRF